MSGSKERRAKHRRYSDRRVAFMLDLHEILFDIDPGKARDEALLSIMSDDFDTDLAAFLVRRGAAPDTELVVVGFDAEAPPRTELFRGPGLQLLLDIQQTASGAITLTRFRRPSVMDQEIWDRMWDEDLADVDATGLLTIAVIPERAQPFYIWLILSGSSREWTSHDRDLAEETARLLARAADKALS